MGQKSAETETTIRQFKALQALKNQERDVSSLERFAWVTSPKEAGFAFLGGTEAEWKEISDHGEARGEAALLSMKGGRPAVELQETPADRIAAKRAAEAEETARTFKSIAARNNLDIDFSGVTTESEARERYLAHQKQAG